MDARFLEKLIYYRNTHQIELAKILISQKIIGQFYLINQPKLAKLYRQELSNASTISEILLIEARAAKQYWGLYAKSFSTVYPLFSRRPHAPNIPNQLLDIGYHYLTKEAIKFARNVNFPTELGFVHSAQAANSQPFAYDFIEWLRPITVDRAVRSILSKHKRDHSTPNPKLASKLVGKIKTEFRRKYYHKKLGYCVSLEYWCYLLLLNLRHFADKNESPYLYFPSYRHETRCSSANKKPSKIFEGRKCESS